MEEKLEQQKPSVSAPPSPEITVRTMDSDIKAIEQGGGEMIAPAKEPMTEIKLDIPGYIGPEKPIFAPTGAISTEQEQPLEKKTNKWKVIGIIVGILIVLVGFGLLGYFIVSPWLFPKEMPAVQ
jgi:hypothetical protein